MFKFNLCLIYQWIKWKLKTFRFFFNIKAGFTKINKGVKIRSSSNIFYMNKLYIKIYMFIISLLYYTSMYICVYVQNGEWDNNITAFLKNRALKAFDKKKWKVGVVKDKIKKENKNQKIAKWKMLQRKTKENVNVSVVNDVLVFFLFFCCVAFVFAFVLLLYYSFFYYLLVMSTIRKKKTQILIFVMYLL